MHTALHHHTPSWTPTEHQGVIPDLHCVFCDVYSRILGQLFNVNANTLCINVIKALRVFPAETRLTVYRRRRVSNVNDNTLCINYIKALRVSPAGTRLTVYRRRRVMMMMMMMTTKGNQR